MSTDKRNETQLLCDILGLESLVDEITSKLPLPTGNNTSNTKNTNTNNTATPSTILGPFYRASAPTLPNGSSLISAAARSQPWYTTAQPLLAHISGRVLSATSGAPIPGATLDIWLAAPNGLYEQQDPDQPDMNLRGRLLTDADGAYAVYAVRPTAYAIPDDGPAGRVLALLDRHPWRPAHIHFVVAADGFRPLTTQLFDCEDGVVGDDAVFAVREELLVRFEERCGDQRAGWQVRYDFLLGEG